MGTAFLTQACNKRSITLDLKKDEDRDILKKLVATADVFVENYRPGSFDALGLGYEALSAINPRLIYASFSAFGQKGPRSEQTAYDHVIQATSGIMAMTGTPEVNPVKFGSPAVDYATGVTGAFALTAALYQRERTGKGQRIDMAMLDVALTLMSTHLTGYLRNGVHPKPNGNRNPHADNIHIATGLMAAEAPTRNFNTAAMLETLQKTMQDNVGALRSRTKITAALHTIGHLNDELGDTPPGDGNRFDMRRIDWFDLRNMLLVSRVVAETALARTETRGAHQREDCPELSPDWALNQTVTLRDRRIEISGGRHSIAEAML